MRSPPALSPMASVITEHKLPSSGRGSPRADAPTTARRVIEGTQFLIASPIMHKFMGMVDRVAGHTETVLVIGETGTGKELVARTIHESSYRHKKPLVDINCAALPEHLVESELFGYEKGAFSGADSSKPGLFELADKSTIFLDEIGELQPQIQVKLLRVLDGAALLPPGRKSKDHRRRARGGSHQSGSRTGGKRRPLSQRFLSPTQPIPVSCSAVARAS